MTASLLVVLLLTACGGPVYADPIITCADPPEPGLFSDEAPTVPDDGTTIDFTTVADYRSVGAGVEIAAGTSGLGTPARASSSLDFICLVPENPALVGETADLTMRAQGLVEATPDVESQGYSEAYLYVLFGPNPPLQLLYARYGYEGGGFVGFDDLLTRQVTLGSWIPISLDAEIRAGAFEGSESVARAFVQISFESAAVGGGGVSLAAVESASGTSY